MKNLLNAISEFQKEIPIIHKNTKGYGYNYADLSQIIEKITPNMKKHNLGFYQAVSGTQLKTVIFHSSGELIEELADIPQGVQIKGMNEFQVLGSAITYMRRYQLSAMLGLVTDCDLDAAGEQKQKGKPDWWQNAIDSIKKGAFTVDQIAKKKGLTPQEALDLQLAADEN